MDKLILGGIGLLIYNKLKKINKNQEIIKQDITKSDEYFKNMDNNKNDQKEENEYIDKYIEYVSKSEKIIKNIETFEDSKIFHGIINNTIAISKSGYIFITSYGNSQLIEIENILKISISKPNINEFPLLYYLILNVKNYEQKEYKMLLTMGNKIKAKEILNDINKEIKNLKNNAKPAHNKQ